MSTNTATEQEDYPDQQGQHVDALIRLLDTADAVPGAAGLRTRSYELLDLEPRAHVVDVGCGAGRAVAELAERGATAVGIDLNDQMITVARRRWPEADFRIGDAYELPLPDATMAGYRADKVFHELDEPERAMREALRVLLPGGRIVLIGQDWDTFVIDSDDPALTRAVVQGRADTVPGPRTARRYRSLLLDAGFRDVTVEVHTGVFTDTTMLPMLEGIAEGAYAAGALTREDTDGWIAEQRRRAETDRLFLAVPLFVAAAHHP